MDALLETIPPIAVYLIVGLVIGLESLGIPLPGEIALVSAALLASRHTLDINPVAVGAAATLGAIVGDTIGYSIGHRWNRPCSRYAATTVAALERVSAVGPTMISRRGDVMSMGNPPVGVR